MLRRQLFRSIWRGRRAYVACVLLLAVGIAIFVAFHLIHVNLDAAMQDFYRQQRFGEAFAAVTRMPLGAVDRVAGIEGVERVSATIVAEARVERADSNRIITLRLNSFDPADGERLNDFLLSAGALPGEGELLLSETFAEAGGWEIGDRITFVLEGTRHSPVISGTVQSPEYVYAIPDTGQILPDSEAFGFGYMPYERLGAISGKAGFATNLSLTLVEGRDFEMVKPQLEDALRAYGLQSLYARKDQPSHVMLNQEVTQIGDMATSFPMLFILIAVIILYIMLKRMIEQERSQIGMLKAFGVGDWAIVRHYLGYGAITGLAGGVTGAALGVWMTAAVQPIFEAFFHLPAVARRPDPTYLLYGLGLALASGLAGAFMGTRSILRLRPGEAMRPPAPPAVRGDLVGRLPVLRALLTSYGFMSLRNITRNRFRSAFVLLGLAVSFAITAFMASYGDMFDVMMLNQFTEVELYNLKVTLAAPAARTPALEAAWALEGIHRAEGVLELPVELRHEHRTKSAPLTAIEAGSRLYRIYDHTTGEALAPERGGLILSAAMAGELGVRRGDLLRVTTPYTGDTVHTLPVLGTAESSLGSGAYIELEGLWELLGIPPTLNGLLLDAQDADPVKTALLEAGNVAAVTDQAEAEKVYRDMLDTYAALIYLLQLAGVGIAFAIVANTATISLSERQREYATMRVLGMHPGEIGRVVGLEYWVLYAAALPPGVLLTRVFKEAMAGMIDNELFALPVGTGLSSFVAATAFCALAVVLSNLSARRKIAGFDMAVVLKERE